MLKIFLKNVTRIICVTLFVMIVTAGVCMRLEAQELNISEGHEWRYFRGTVDLSKKWNQVDFDDSSWQKGSSGFGYGDGKNNTVLSDMRGKYKSIYVRTKFTVNDSHGISRLVLSVVCDGPFIAYLDGIEAIRSRKPQKGDPLNLIGFAHELDHRINVLAIKCSNDDINSDDFSFIPSFQFKEK